jgi:peptidyl-Lys metalloendopeptidase
VAVGAAPAQRGEAPLTTTLQVAKWHHALTDEIALTYSLTNNTAEPLYVLRWETPFEGINGDIFQVERDGQPVLYTGRLYKRAAPIADDYIELQPFESRSVTIDLSAVYRMSRTGEYSVRYRPYVLDVVASLDAPAADREAAADGGRLVTVDSSAVTLFVEGTDDDVSLDLELPEYGIGGYTSCSNTRQTQISTAFGYSKTMSTKAYNYLVNNGNSTLYRYWFGAYTSTRLSTVKTHFSKIKDALYNKSMTFDCSCTDNAYAYVYPGSPYKIYLCKAFWSAPTTGRDSKAGTIIHETSHFYVVASTKDYVYGATGAHNLALSSPTKAIANADNHEYFSEDQP